MATVTDKSGNLPDGAAATDISITKPAQPVNFTLNGAAAVSAPNVPTTGVGVQAVGLVGQYLVTPPTLTDGQYGRVQLDANGNVKATLTGVALNTTVATAYGTGLAAYAVNAFGRMWDGANWQAVRGDAANGLVVQSSASEFETVAASATDQVIGVSGAVGDLLDSILIIPATTSPGVVQIRDGAGGSTITIFTGGASSVSNLVPFSVPLGLKCVTGTSPGWRVTTGANVSVIAIGNFT